jgi:hypothetical protein
MSRYFHFKEFCSLEDEYGRCCDGRGLTRLSVTPFSFFLSRFSKLLKSMSVNLSSAAIALKIALMTESAF